MRLTDCLTAILPAQVENADGDKVIPAGSRVTLTLLDSTEVGVHFNGTHIIATLGEVLGAELFGDAPHE